MIFGRKLEMEIILNASLAGGVVMGANAGLIANAYGSMLAGFITGFVSAFGFGYLGPWLREKIYLHDTCGIHNLHGMPGFIGGILSAIMAARGEINFGDNYDKTLINGQSVFFDRNLRTPSEQAGF